VTYQLCKRQSADTVVIIGRYRLSAKRPIIGQYQSPANYRCISTHSSDNWALEPLTRRLIKNLKYLPQICQEEWKATTRLWTTRCGTRCRTVPDDHCRMGWMNAEQMQRQERRRMTAIESSSENNSLPVKNDSYTCFYTCLYAKGYKLQCLDTAQYQGYIRHTTARTWMNIAKIINLWSKKMKIWQSKDNVHNTTTTILRPFVRDYPGNR